MKMALWILAAAAALAGAAAQAGEPFDYRDTLWRGPGFSRLLAPGAPELQSEEQATVAFSRNRTWQYDGAGGAFDDWKSNVAGDFDAEGQAWLAERAEDALASRGHDPGELTLLPGPRVVGRVSSDRLHLRLKMFLRYRIGAGPEVVREWIRTDLARLDPDDE